MSSAPQVLKEWARDLADDQLPSGSYEKLLRAYSNLRAEMEGRTLALASAAHELKTPLSVLSGYLEVLLSGKLGPLTDRQCKVLRAMQASGVRLQQFIQDFLTYTALEAGNVTVKREISDLNDCLKELYEIWLPGFQNKGIALYLVANGKVRQFPFDYHKVQRVLSNLLENAYSCTPVGGTVWLTTEPYFWDRRVREHGEAAAERRGVTKIEPNAARINVCDTGSGIAPEFHQEIFEDFVSLRHSADAHGTGLGLAIARRLMQAQHGKIWVESDLGAGSRFSLLLPLQP